MTECLPVVKKFTAPLRLYKDVKSWLVFQSLYSLGYGNFGEGYVDHIGDLETSGKKSSLITNTNPEANSE